MKMSSLIRLMLKELVSKVLLQVLAWDRFGSKKQSVPFVVLCNGRVGSNALISLLNNHPSVLALNELMHPHNPIFGYSWHQLILSQSDAVNAIRSRNPWQFLVDYCFGRVRLGRISRQGFKLIYWHVLGEENERVWRRLLDVNGIRIIHLVRKNELERLVSEERARLLNEWIKPVKKNMLGKHKRLNSVSTNKQIYISPEKAERYFDINSELLRRFRADLNRSNFIEIEYDDLLGKNASVSALASVFRFLGLEVLDGELAAWKPGTDKQIQAEIDEIVENYSELALYFKNTRYSSFFQALDR